MTKAAVLWSGGKDAAHALHWAVSAGYDVVCLISLIESNLQLVEFHGTPESILSTHAESLGLVSIREFFQQETAADAWHRGLERARALGATVCVSGDYALSPGRSAFLGRVFGASDVKLLRPFLGLPTPESLGILVADGIVARIIAADLDLIPRELLGSVLEHETIRSLGQLSGVDPAGAKGEYHTLTTDSPQFGRRLVIHRSVERRIGRYTCVVPTEWSLEPK